MRALDDELYAAFLREAGIARSTIRPYRYAIDLYSAFLEDRGLILEEVTPLEVDAFASLLWSEHSNACAHAVFSVVKRLHRWAADNGFGLDVARGIAPKMKATPYSRLGITVDQARCILAAAEEGRDGALVNLMVRSALKTGDLEGMRVRDVLLYPGGGEIRVGGCDWVPITAKCAQALSSHLDRMGADSENRHSALFQSRSCRNLGEALTSRSIRRIAGGICRSAGISDEAGEYNIGSAALELAIAEGEPLEVVLAISDRTWRYRTANVGRGPLWL